jgi:N-acetylglutamate synthase-like GNAT family acetyltransferase
MKASPPPVTLRPASPADWPAVEALLRTHQLPVEGAREHLATYLLAFSGAELVGCAGAEVYGDRALLRSVAVAPGLQRQGIGRLLVERLLQEAARRRLRSVHLLTVTAPEYFARHGFRRGPVAEAPPALKASVEFQGACPACAAFMTLPLADDVAPADDALPVAVIGAGPVGLAAVARLLERSMTPLVFEAGAQVGANLLDYGHVRLFSPWRYNIDAAVAAQLTRSGWTAPPDDELPLAGDVARRVLQPFAALPQVAPHLHLGTRVLAISREGFDKVKTVGREQAPFLIRTRDADGTEREWRARAVIDASGTWNTPNPLGAHGLPAQGEAELAAHIAYGIPDVSGALRERYAGRRTLVVGAGHSAANALLALADLARQAPGTGLAWAVRSRALQRVFGGGAADALPARGALGSGLKALRDSGGLEFVPGLRITALRRESGSITVEGRDPAGKPLRLDGIDEIICATGQRPDLSLAAELRVRLDPWLESTEALGPLIDPNLHSCGTVRPHGHRELAHPEPGLYTVGVKSYGRAPTFLMATGFEQVRSVVAAIAGDLAAADRVELDLPETGVCSAPGLGDEDASTGGCCGPADSAPALAAASAAAPAAAGGCGPGACSVPAPQGPLRNPVPVAVRAGGCC